MSQLGAHEEAVIQRQMAFSALLVGCVVDWRKAMWDLRIDWAGELGTEMQRALQLGVLALIGSG